MRVLNRRRTTASILTYGPIWRHHLPCRFNTLLTHSILRSPQRSSYPIPSERLGTASFIRTFALLVITATLASIGGMILNLLCRLQSAFTIRCSIRTRAYMHAPLQRYVQRTRIVKSGHIRRRYLTRNDRQCTATRPFGAKGDRRMVRLRWSAVRRNDTTTWRLGSTIGGRRRWPWRKRLWA